MPRTAGVAAGCAEQDLVLLEPRHPFFGRFEHADAAGDLADQPVAHRQDRIGLAGIAERHAMRGVDRRQHVGLRRIDVAIGTHKLLSKDVHFADLGLLEIGRAHV